MFKPKIYEYNATLLNWFVNAYLVETQNGVVMIDGAVGITSGKEIRDIIDNKIKKPLIAVLLTHGHPDHYTGVVNVMKEKNVPFYSTREAFIQLQDKDEHESGDMKIYFGNEYPEMRIFPDHFVKHGEVITIDNVDFHVHDFGACESESDAVWSLNIDGIKHFFIGDLIYNKMHSYFGEGHVDNWLKALDKLYSETDVNSVFYASHGNKCGTEMIFWQKAYIHMFVDTIKELVRTGNAFNEDGKKILAERLKSFLPNDELLFLVFFNLDETIKKIVG
jgi:glyoxylase-like metal-dependent hydrolase (beta-lactamase superfamily II)